MERNLKKENFLNKLEKIESTFGLTPKGVYQLDDELIAEFKSNPNLINYKDFYKALFLENALRNKQL